MHRFSSVIAALILLALGSATAFAAGRPTTPASHKKTATAKHKHKTRVHRRRVTAAAGKATTAAAPMGATTATTPTPTTPTTTPTTTTEAPAPTPTTSAPAPTTDPVPAAPAAPLFGFNDNGVAFGQLTAPVSAQLASQAGAGVSRITFDWRWAEPTQGVWKLATYDAIYAADLAQGIRPIFILQFAPQWAWAGGTACVQATQDCRYPPSADHLDAWRTVVTKLVQRYPKMAALEVWNEPNLGAFWQGGINPTHYTTLLGEAHAAVQAAGSSVPVLGGALSNYQDANTSTLMNARTFLNAMYAAGAKGKMDGLSLHPYPDDIDLWRFFKTLTEVRSIRDDNDDTVPLWVSEIGVTTVGAGSNYTFNENDQALMLKKLEEELRGMEDVKAMLFHTLVDPSIFPATNSERGFGTLHVDLSPKPAFCMFAAVNKTSYVCPSGVAALTELPAQKRRWAAQDLVQAAADAARTWYRSHGTYAGLTPAGLHAINPALSASGADGTLAPGPSADPSRVGVWVWGTAGAENLLLCNTSQAERSYCIETQHGNPWVYGKAEGTVNAAAGATSTGSIWWW